MWLKDQVPREKVVIPKTRRIRKESPAEARKRMKNIDADDREAALEGKDGVLEKVVDRRLVGLKLPRMNPEKAPSGAVVSETTGVVNAATLSLRRTKVDV
jgi:hypothetical protein